jgi:HTH-type transcriptional regulator / antitoxin HigA
MKRNTITRAVKDDYLDLVRGFPLRPIRTEADYDLAIELLKDLAGRGVRKGLTTGERDYLDALTQFISVYETVHYPIPHVLKTPLARLKYIMKESGMTTVELGELLGSGKGQASLILNGKREMSKANIRVLADRFKVSPALFL